MKCPVPWQESEDYAPDLSSDTAAPADQESEDDDDFWGNMIFPI